MVCGDSLRGGHPGGQGRRVSLGQGFPSTSQGGPSRLLLTCWRSLEAWWGHLGHPDQQQLWGGGIGRIWVGMGWTWSMERKGGMWVGNENERGRGFCFQCCGGEWYRIFSEAWDLISPVGKRISSGHTLDGRLWSQIFQGRWFGTYWQCIGGCQSKEQARHGCQGEGGQRGPTIGQFFLLSPALFRVQSRGWRIK